MANRKAHRPFGAVTVVPYGHNMRVIPRKILDETDWSALENRNGPSYPDTPTLLSGLTSDDLPAVEAALFHLSHGLIEYPNAYSAAVPAAQYVAAVLDDPHSNDLLVQGRPLRAALLTWLAGVVDSVSDARERDFIELAGYSPMDYPTSTFRKIREIRPQLFSAVAAHLSDHDPVVRQEAVAAAVVIAMAPELTLRRAMLMPAVRDVLAVSSSPAHRRLATTAIQAWSDDSGPA